MEEFEAKPIPALLIRELVKNARGHPSVSMTLERVRFSAQISRFAIKPRPSPQTRRNDLVIERQLPRECLLVWSDDIDALS